MKIRTQTLVAIVPLFLGLIAADGALIYYSQQKELMWGLRRQVRSLTVATTEHTRAALAQAPGTDALRATLQPIYDRIAETNGLNLLRLSAPTGEILVTAGARPERASAVAVLPEVPRALDGGGAFVSDIVRHASDDTAMVGVQRIDGPDGKPLAIVEVETDAAVFEAEMAGVFRLILISSGVVLLAAMALAWVLGGKVSSKIRQLNQRASDLVDGREGRWEPTGGVREIEELDDSFRTIHSVLNSELGKSRRKLLENEQFRTREDLLETLGETIMAPIEGRLGGREVVARCINPLSGYFMGTVELGERAIVVLGRASEADPVDRSVTASSLLFLLRQTLVSRPVREALARVAELFPGSEIVCLKWDGAGAPVRRIDLSRDGRIEERTLTIETGEQSCAVHNLEGNGGAILARYLDRYAGLRPTELVRDLDVVLGRRFDGCFVLLRDAA